MTVRIGTCAWDAMLIVCPTCDSRYEIDAAKIGPAGRKVRCAACKNSWQVEPSAPERATAIPDEFPAAPTEAETAALLAQELDQAAEIDENLAALIAERQESAEMAPEDAPAKPARKAGRSKRIAARGDPVAARLSRGMAPVAVALAGLGLIGLGLWQRNAVVRAAPQFAALYERIGLPVNTRGLAFSAVESDVVQDQQGRFLVVEGDVTNISRTVTTMPPISVSVRGAAGEVLYTWTTDPPRPSLEPSELVRFRARLAAPPADGRSVQVRFVSDARAPATALH